MGEKELFLSPSHILVQIEGMNDHYPQCQTVFWAKLTHKSKLRGTETGVTSSSFRFLQ